MESSEKREACTVLYWDIFRSWRDRLPEKGRVFNLFCGHGLEQAGLPVTNWSPPACGPFIIKRFEGRVLASNQALLEKALQETVVHLWVSDRLMFQAQLYYLEGLSNQAELRLVDESGVNGTGEGDLGGVDLGEGITVPPHTKLQVAVDFSGLAPRVDQMFHERGPAAEWIEIRVYLSGTLMRPVH